MGKIAILLVSGELEKLQSASTIASVASSLGEEVLVFATMYGLLAFKKDVVEKKSWKSYGELGEGLIESDLPLFLDVLKEAKTNENLKIYACSMVLGMLNLSITDFIDIFDDVVGVATFLEMVEDAKILFI